MVNHLTIFSFEIFLKRGLISFFFFKVYRAVLAFAAENADKLQSLDAQDRRLVTKILLDFQRNGLALAEDKQAKV